MTDSPFGNPDGPDHDHQVNPIGAHDPDAHQPVKFLTVDEILSAARVVERTASICLRADLTAEHDVVLAELGALVTPSGDIIGGDEERGMDEESNAARAQRLSDRLQHLKKEMRASVAHVRFRAMTSDEWTTFKKLWWPKGKDPDMTDFRTKLIAKCAIEPTISEDQSRQMRATLSASQFTSLSDTAFDACQAGGLDVPKSPSSWVNLREQ